MEGNSNLVTTKLYDAVCAAICVAGTVLLIVMLVPAVAMCAVLGRLMPESGDDWHFRM